MTRLGHTDAHCAALFTPPSISVPAQNLNTPQLATPSVRSPSFANAHASAPPFHPSPLAEESLQGFVMLVSGHFQGYCRDLYSECSQICAVTVSADLRMTLQAQFGAELKLNSGNPTAENIRKDFERFGFLLDLANAAPQNPVRMTHLAHLNYWRNTVAHQKPTPSPAGVPSTLTLSDVQLWRDSCDGLGISLDDIMRRELLRILGTAPW